MVKVFTEMMEKAVMMPKESIVAPVKVDMIIMESTVVPAREAMTAKASTVVPAREDMIAKGIINLVGGTAIPLMEAVEASK